MLLLSWLLITGFCSAQVIEVPVGEFFWQELTPQFLNFTYTTGKNLNYSPSHMVLLCILLIDEPPNIYYSVSSSISNQPFAGLPAWLSFYQRNSSSAGIVYGTPTFADVGRLDVQVVALDRKLFNTVKVIISLNVVEGTLKTGMLPAV